MGKEFYSSDVIDRAKEKLGINPATSVENLSGDEQLKAVAAHTLVRSVAGHSIAHDPENPLKLFADFRESTDPLQQEVAKVVAETILELSDNPAPVVE